MCIWGFQWLFCLGTLSGLNAYVYDPVEIVHRVGAFLHSEWAVASLRKWRLHGSVAMVFCSLVDGDEKASPQQQACPTDASPLWRMGVYWDLLRTRYLAKEWEHSSAQSPSRLPSILLNPRETVNHRHMVMSCSSHIQSVSINEGDVWGKSKGETEVWLVYLSHESRLSECCGQDWNPFSQYDVIIIKQKIGRRVF